MSVLNQIAFHQNRRNEVPNQALARELAATKNKKGIREIAENLWNDNSNVQSDCVKVLYEIGYLDPKLIIPYVHDFVKLLQSKHNRLVWGGMIALSTIATIKAMEIFAHHAEIQKAMEGGSVITMDNGVKTLALVASTDNTRRKVLFPYLLKHLATCRPNDVPQHAEKIVVAVNASNQQAFERALERRMSDLKGSQAARVKRIIKDTDAR